MSISFGHSCYGGFGKRSSSTPELPQADDSRPMLKVIPRHLLFHQDIQQQQQQQQPIESMEQEREIKLIVLNALSQIVDDTIKKLTDFENN
jgi:predicted metal-binding protein